MRVSEVGCGAAVTLEVKPAGGTPFPPGWGAKDEVFLTRDQANGETLVRCGDQAPVPAAGADPRTQKALDALLEANLPRLCWLARREPRTGPAHRLVLQVHLFH